VFAAPGVTLFVSDQSVAAFSVSVPLWRRENDFCAVLLSATAAAIAVPSTRLTVPTPGIGAAVMDPSGPICRSLGASRRGVPAIPQRHSSARRAACSR
jgi:hypothetical protein